MTRIREYHQPTHLEETMALLSRATPITRPLAGGTHYRRGWAWPEAVVDLAALKLDGIVRGEHAWVLGATATLDQLAASEDLPAALRQAALRQAPRNSRQRATIGGAIAARDSGTLLVCLLALDARIMVEPGSRLIPLESYLHDSEEGGHLITACFLPNGRRCAFDEISRTPADAPILAIAVGADVGGAGLRRVIAAGGGADQPVVVAAGAVELLQTSIDAEIAALASAMIQAPWHSDVRGTAEYRAAMTPVLLRRAVSSFLASQEVSHAG